MSPVHSSVRPDDDGLLGSRLSAVAKALVALCGASVLRCLPRRAAEQLSLSQGRGDGPPDLDELWRDFNAKLSRLFGIKSTHQRPSTPQGSPDGDGPNRVSAGLGIGLIAGILLLIWAGSGFFIVQEGHQSVVTTFGKFSHTVGAGIQWRAPYPFQAHETVAVTELRKAEVGRNTVTQSTGLKDSSMLTQDENIVDIRFTVQYRIKDARDWLFENANSEQAVVQAAESAVREIVGRNKVDSVLYEQRDALASDLVKLIQVQLDRLKAGVVVANVNVQNVQVPEQVQSAFNDAFKAGADRDRFKNEGQAYASDVIPKAQGTAARLREQAEGYRQRVIAQAEGDSQRFKSVHAEYQKAPAVTRDRLYIDTMQEVFANVTKVMVDSKANNNLLYLPLDKLIQQTNAAALPASASAPAPTPDPAAMAGGTVDPRARDAQRSR